MFFSNICWTQLLASLEILMSKISLKYIPFIFTIMNMKLSSHGFLFHRNINRTKKQSPNSLHNEKNQRVYFWGAEKDNWASQISEVALRKELELWKSHFHHTQRMWIGNERAHQLARALPVYGRWIICCSGWRWRSPNEGLDLGLSLTVVWITAH